MDTRRKFWTGLILLAVLSPLGLLLPHYFKAGVAWGEWGQEKLRELAGYVPEGLAKWSSLWRAPLAGYEFRQGEGKSSAHAGLDYVASAFLGVIICAGAAFVLGRFLSRKK